MTVGTERARRSRRVAADRRRARRLRTGIAPERSAELHARARQSMPLGVASSFQTYDPYPLFMTDARGSRIWDADGNEYVDFDMAFGVLAAGHSHPLLAEALQRRVANGTCYTFPVEDGILLAEEIKRRFGADLVRFSNSGTEATMDAIRVARGYTGREKIVKFEGGYHGHHDDVLVSIQPPRELMGPVESPATVPASAGLPASRLAETIIAPFNEPELLEAILEAHRGEVAAIIVEPVQFNIGVVPPRPGFLERLRELATDHGAVLIFDEVKTGVVLAYGGATEHFGVQPDLFCLAKSIGGGVPIGAFGGRARGDGRHRGGGGRCAGGRNRALDPRRRSNPRRAPRHLQRQPALHERGPRDPDPDPHRRRLSRAARLARSADGRLPGGARRVRAARAMRSTSGPRGA